MPKISIIVPVYQAEDYLERAVRSVLAQSFQDWELLLINDGSRDGSLALCQKFAQEDSRIRWFTKENGGVSSARNLGLAEATGESIAFLDSDDHYEPAFLATLYNLQMQEGIDTAGCGHYNWWEGGAQSVERLLPQGTYDKGGMQGQIVAPLLGDRLAQPVLNGFIWRILFDATILREHSIIFDGPYLEDELFLLEYFCHAQGLAVTEAPLYWYFYNPNSATHKYMANFLTIFDEFMKRKGALVKAHQLESLHPLWRENTLWAGLLIAVGNIYAKGRTVSHKERRQEVRALCQREDMAKAIATVTPTGLGTNKKLVANLLLKRQYLLLHLMYRLKNRM